MKNTLVRKKTNTTSRTKTATSVKKFTPGSKYDFEMISLHGRRQGRDEWEFIYIGRHPTSRNIHLFKDVNGLNVVVIADPTGYTIIHGTYDKRNYGPCSAKDYMFGHIENPTLPKCGRATLKVQKVA